MKEKNQKKRKFYIKKLLFGYFGVSFIFGSIVIFFMDIQNTTLLDFFMTAIIFSIGTLFMYFALKSREIVIDDEYRPQQESSYAVDEFADMVGNTKNQEKRKLSARKLLLSFLFTIFGVPCIMLSIFAFYTEKPTTADAIIPFSIIGLLGIFFLYLAVKPGKHKSSETVVDDVYRPQQEVRYAVDEFADTVEKQNYETANSTESNEQKKTEKKIPAILIIPAFIGSVLLLITDIVCTIFLGDAAVGNYDRQGLPTKWMIAKTIMTTSSIVLLVVAIVLTHKNGFGFYFFKGFGITLIGMALGLTPQMIDYSRWEAKLPPEIKAACEAERQERLRRERERAERRADTFNSLLWYHIFFGKKR